MCVIIVVEIGNRLEYLKNKRMTISNILYKILNYKELTSYKDIKDKIHYVIYDNNYYCEIDEDIALVIIQSDIVDLDSVNFDTCEKHYVLNLYNDNILKRIDYLIKNINADLYKSEILLNELKTIRKNENRKQKIINLNKI